MSKSHQGQEARAFEGYYSLTLVLSAIAGTFTTEKFAARGNQLCQDGQILVVYQLDLVTTKATTIVVSKAWFALALAKFFSLKSHC